jgi:two-component sensor histidine kinase
MNWQTCVPCSSRRQATWPFCGDRSNAAKYGALSEDSGKVELVWLVDCQCSPLRLKLRWREMGGPPVGSPQSQGFGTRLIEHNLAQDFGGEARIEFARQGASAR